MIRKLKIWLLKQEIQFSMRRHCQKGCRALYCETCDTRMQNSDLRIKIFYLENPQRYIDDSQLPF